MPQKPPKPCARAGCPKLTHDRFCDEHARREQQRFDRDRGTAAQRGYDARWRRLRKMILARNPLCSDPFGIHKTHGETIAATEVDHVMPRRAGGGDRLGNLQALCKPCHSRKTAGEVGFAGEGGGKSS